MPVLSIAKPVSAFPDNEHYTIEVERDTAVIQFALFDQDGTIDKINRNGWSAYSLIRFAHKVEAGRTVAYLVIRNFDGTHWERVMGFCGHCTNINHERVESVAPGELCTWRIG